MFSGCDERRSSVVVRGKKISRSHCEIRFKSGSVYVTDCRVSLISKLSFKLLLSPLKQSRNGTFVNNKRVKREQKLRVGDLIGLGTNPLPLRNYDEEQFVYSLCSAPQKVLDEINVELFSFGAAEPDFSGININIDAILKSLEDDSNLSVEADMKMNFEDRIHDAMYQEEVKIEQSNQHNLESQQQICEVKVKMEQIEEVPCASASPVRESDKVPIREFYERSNAALWDEVDLSAETYQPHLKQLFVRVVKMTDVTKFLDSLQKSSARKRKLKELHVTKPDKKAKVVKKTKEIKETSKLIKNAPKILKLSDESTKLTKSLETCTSQNSKLMTPAPTTPKTARSRHKKLLDNVNGSPHPRKRKAALVGAIATALDKSQSLETMTPRTKSTRSDPSPVQQYRVISARPTKQLKSILVNSERSKKKSRKKSVKVTFCKSVYIKEYIQEEDFDSEPWWDTPWLSFVAK